MRTSHILASVIGLSALVALGTLWSAQQPPPPEGVEVLARGPVHEAFAEPTEPRPQASPIVTKPPPEPVQEIPPEERPEGDDVEWIPGYWAYDDESQDYLWVSGFWREP